MPVPAAARLVEFKIVPGADQPRHVLPALVRPKTQAEIAADEQAERVADAFLRGRREGLDTARAEGQAKLDEAHAAFEERLAAERAAWAADEGARLAERIDAALDTLSTNVGDAVADILTPFVEEALRARVVEELLRTLEKVLKGGRPTTLKITGPEDILDAIRRTLGDTATAIDFETTGDVDARIVADSTVIETQLEAWRRRIRGE